MRNMVLILLFILVQLFLNPQHGLSDNMFCNKGNVYTGDSEAEVITKCGQPMQIFRSDPIKIEEKLGNRTITRWVYQYIYVYPASRGYLYYLKFENHKLMSIDLGYPGEIPK